MAESRSLEASRACSRPDLNTLSSFLISELPIRHGPYQNLNDQTPAKRYLLEVRLQPEQQNKISFRYNQLDSSSRAIFRRRRLLASAARWAALQATCTSDRRTTRCSRTSSRASASGIRCRQHDVEQPHRRSHVERREPRGHRHAVSLRRYPAGRHVVHVVRHPSRSRCKTSCDTRRSSSRTASRSSARAHTLTFGATTQRYQSENVFWSCCPQSNYTYNSLEDFYTDANDYLANPNRTTSPVTLRRFKVRYSNVPGLEKPLQPLQVWYSGAYAQDEWRPRRDLTVTAGLRIDVSVFKNTAYRERESRRADVPRSRTARRCSTQTGEMPDPKMLWSPRIGRNWDVGRPWADAGAGGHGPLHRAPALCVDLEPARQYGRAHRRDSGDNTTRFRSTRIRTATSRPT